MVKARHNSNWKLVWEVPDGLLWAVAERQVRVFPGVEAALQMTYEMSPLVTGRTKPGRGRLVEHRIEEHYALDHPPRCSGLSESTVRLADGCPERLVVDMKHPSAMKLARRNRCRKSSLDERLDEVGTLLTVDDACKCAVLTLDEDARMQQHVHEESSLALREAERCDRAYTLGVCQLDRPSIGRRRQAHPSSSSASFGCREPPRLPVLAHPPTIPPMAR
jgi:hypothetical protein